MKRGYIKLYGEINIFLVFSSAELGLNCYELEGFQFLDMSGIFQLKFPGLSRSLDQIMIFAPKPALKFFKCIVNKKEVVKIMVKW